MSTLDVTLTVDDRECVFSSKIYSKVNGLISIKVESVTIEINYSEDDSEDKEPKTNLNRKSDNVLEISCVNHNAYSPLSRGIVKPIGVFVKDGIQHYLQFTSSIYTRENDCRELELSISRDK